MKKWLSLLLALAMALPLAACGSAGNQENTPEPPASVSGSTAEETPAPTDAETAAEEPAEEPAESETPAAEDSGSVLIAYFSATGNTEHIAEHLAGILDADLYEIVPEAPYTSEDLNYSNSDCRANQEQNDPAARPAISGGVENMADYEVIFLGYPIWWGDAPKILSTFLESYDFHGKTIVPFCTSGSSPIGGSASGLEALTDGATWLDGQRFSGSASRETVSQWVDSLGLALGQAA